MSETTPVVCKACGASNDVLTPDDSFDEQLKYAALQFACRVCGAALAPAGKNADADAPPEPEPKS